MIILKSQNKITDFLMIQAWLSPINCFLADTYYRHQARPYVCVRPSDRHF